VGKKKKFTVQKAEEYAFSLLLPRKNLSVVDGLLAAELVAGRLTWNLFVVVVVLFRFCYYWYQICFCER